MVLGISGINGLHCVDVTLGVISFAFLVLLYGFGSQ
jgi:hypothetical protein